MGFVPRFADEWVLLRILKAVGGAPIRLAVKGGPDVALVEGSPIATLVFQDRKTLAGLLRDPEIGFGDAYMDGRIEVEGDFVRFLEAIYGAMNSTLQASHWLARLKSNWLDVWQNNSLHGSRKNIQRHYDLGNDFYKLWLDSQLVYTCAYFPTPESSLEQAQVAKMDHVCRKLRLQPGETVVEAGCGWGALAIHMAREHGVRVKAFNVSQEQIAFARDRARAERLSDRVEFIEDDYRTIRGKFDAFVSIGMLEHVGEAHFPEFADVIERAIGKTGRGLVHFIGRNYPANFSRWIRKRIFPGAYVPSLKTALTVLEPKNYSVLDVENLRMHYEKTLEHWLDRFERSKSQIAGMYDSRFVRAWRLYLAGSLAAFRVGHLQLFQILFTGSEREPLFWTRDPIYARDHGGPPTTNAERLIENAKWTHAMS